MIKAYAGVYAGAWRYMLACPLLFALPVVVEFIQHVIEMRIGMYDSIAAAQAVEANGLRLAWGVVKVLSLFLAGYWVARFLLLPGGAADARRFDPVAARLYARVLLFSLAVTLVSLLGGDAMHTAGLGAHTMAAGAAFSLVSFVLAILLAPWKVGAALGNAELGFVRSIRLVGWGAWWGIALTVLAVLPPMVLHYAFAIAAIGNQPAAIWALMAVDSLLVGFLGAIIAATDVAIARRAAGDTCLFDEKVSAPI
ncbi:MAG: hypothetical protein QOH47_2932 [Sphingomonadales bacterium]|jgi:hypothetical protein|nr:hypothetical protein [Sphingomonadales bacterium]